VAFHWLVTKSGGLRLLTPRQFRCAAGRIFIDPLNEPDSMQIAWEPAGGKPGARQLYLRLADRLWQLTPRAMLFMFEGTGQNMFGLNWVGGAASWICMCVLLALSVVTSWHISSVTAETTEDSTTLLDDGRWCISRPQLWTCC
jgi:hypothetical protein